MDKSKKPEPIIPYLLVRQRLQKLNPSGGQQRVSPPGAEETGNPVRRTEARRGGGSMAVSKKKRNRGPKMLPCVLQGILTVWNVQICIRLNVLEV